MYVSAKRNVFRSARKAHSLCTWWFTYRAATLDAVDHLENGVLSRLSVGGV